ncbi:MAG: Wzz/FepE/Etk N-terminal domain-containing protein [Promethearchaeota archaeon]
MKEHTVDLLDIILIVLKNKKKLVINFIGIAIISIIISLLLPKYYKSTIVFIPPNPNSGSGLSALMHNFSVDILGSNDLSKQQINTLINSRDIREKVIEKFNLIKLYKTSNATNYLEKALRILDRNIEINIDEEGGLGFADIISFSVSVYDKDAKRASEMVEFLIKQVDIAIRILGIQRAAANKKFIWAKIEELKDSLSLAREKLNAFQIKNKIFNPTEQVKIVIESIAKMKAEVISLETQRSYLATQQNYEHPDIKKLNIQINAIQKKIKELETKKSKDIMVGLESSLELMNIYADLLVEVESLQGVIVLLRQQYEQAKIQESKDIPSLRIVDHAKVAQWKAKPKRAYYVIVITFIYMFLIISFIIVQEFTSRQRDNDPQSLEKIDKVIKELKFWNLRKTLKKNE